MKKIAVLYYSRTGNTRAMADLIAEGARRVPGTHVDVSPIEEFAVEKVIEYDGFIVGSPTYYGCMAHQVKKFFDDSVVYHGKLAGKVGAAFSSAANIGGGNETTITGILFAMLIHGMVVQGMEKGDHFGPVAIGAPDERVREQCRIFGERIAGLAGKVG